MTNMEDLDCYACGGKFPSKTNTVKVLERDEDGEPTKIVHRQGRCRLVHDGKLESYDDRKTPEAPPKHRVPNIQKTTGRGWKDRGYRL